MATVRVNDISRQLGVKSKYVLRYLKDIGIYSKSHSASIDECVAIRIRQHFAVGNAKSTFPNGVQVVRPSERIAESPSAPPSSRRKTDPARTRSNAPAPGNLYPPKKIILPAPPESRPRYKAAINIPAPYQAMRSGRNPQALPHAPADKGRSRGQSKVERKTVPCLTCGADVPRVDIAEHIEKHRVRAIDRRRTTEVERRIERTNTSMPEENARREHALQSPARPHGRDLAKHEICPECKRLVPTAFMNQHKEEQHARPHLPDFRTARYSFVILPSGNDWDYRTVFEHYRKMSHSYHFENRSIDPKRLKQHSETILSAVRGRVMVRLRGIPIFLH